jgi:altronate dehydratase
MIDKYVNDGVTTILSEFHEIIDKHEYTLDKNVHNLVGIHKSNGNIKRMEIKNGERYSNSNE